MTNLCHKCKSNLAKEPRVPASLARVAKENVTTFQAADILNCTVRRVFWLLQIRALPYVRLGKVYIIPRSAVIALAEKERQAATTCQPEATATTSTTPEAVQA